MLLKRNKSTLYIEISPWGVNIIEGVRSARQAKIINYSHISDLPESKEELVKKIALSIKKMSAKTNAVHLVIPHPYIEVQSQHVNLSKKEAAALVKRKVKKREQELLAELQQGDSYNVRTDKKASTLYSDYQIRGKGGLLFAIASQKLVDEYIHLLEAVELDPLLITSPPLALANTLLFMAQDAKDSDSKDYISFLSITPNQGWLIIVNQDSFFSREILLQVEAPKEQEASASDGPVVKSSEISHNASAYRHLLVEVSRSFLYIQQQNKEVQVSSLLVGSSGDLPEGIIENLAEKLQISVKLFDPAEKLNVGDTAEKNPELPQILKTLPVSLGLLVDTHNQISLNLVPLKVREHKKQMAKGLFIGLFFTAYCLLIGASYIGLSWAQENYRKAAENQQQSIEHLKPACEQAKKFEQNRRRRDFQLSVLKRFERTEPLWRGVLYELSLLPHPKMTLSSLDIIERGGKWCLTAKGVVSANTSKKAQQHLKGFLKHLEESVFFSHPKAANISMTPAQLGEGPLDRGSIRTQLKFTLTCNIMR